MATVPRFLFFQACLILSWVKSLHEIVLFFFFPWQGFYVERLNDNNVSNLVTLHTELSSMLMMDRPPPCSTEMLTFNLCTVISQPRGWNWCTLFLLIKSKNSRGPGQVGPAPMYSCHKDLADSRMNQRCCSLPIGVLLSSQVTACMKLNPEI